MSTVTDTTTPGFFARVSRTLRNWGSKAGPTVKKVGNWFWSLAKKAGGFIKRGATWLYRTKAVQWVAGKSKVAGGWVWKLLKGPARWLAIPLAAVAAFLAAPKVMAVMMVVILLVLVVITVLIVMGVRALKNLDGEDFVGKMDEFISKAEEAAGVASEFAYANAVKADETVASRSKYLDEQLDHTAERGNTSMYCEAFARRYLLEARAGKGGKIKANASQSVIHRASKDALRKAKPSFSYDPGLMWRSLLDEDRRLKEIETLKANKAEQPKLTPV